MKSIASTDFFIAAPITNARVFVAQALDGCGANVPTTTMKQAVVNQITKDEFASSSTIKVYPNPVSGGSFFIETKKNAQNATIQLFDMNGKLQSIIIENKNNNSKKIVLNQVSKGFYLLKIITDTKTEFVKITVQ